MSFSPTPRDRILMVAPHPDDESLAAGGLLLKAREAGAAVRILFATDGDNNPWPQRWVERRWRIGKSERNRWGATRRREAIAAVAQLGFPAEAGRFLAFPDQGITARLLKADPEALGAICRELEAWRPTVLILPSPHDLHPDHNALSVLFQIALDRLRLSGVRQLHFVVHCRRLDRIPARLEIALTEAERVEKRRAILCHKTQMALSRKRFLAYARPFEIFFEAAGPAESMPGHRVREAFLHAGALQLAITLPARPWEGTSLFLAFESLAEGSHRWRLPLPVVSGKARLRDAGTGAALRNATVRIKGRLAVVRIPIARVQPLSRLFVKLHRRTLFLDDAGWREVPVAAPAAPAAFKAHAAAQR